MQEAIVILCDHVAAILTKACHLQSSPYRITGEQLVVGRNTGKLDHAELQHQMINQLLSLGLTEFSCLHIPGNINIQEGRDSANRHGSTILCLDGCQIAKVQPLYCFMGILCRCRNIIPIQGSHLLHAFQGTDLIGNLLTLADDIIHHRAITAVLQIFLLCFDQVINAIQSNPAVITHNASTAIRIRQTSHDMRVAGSLHLIRVRIKHSLIMRLMILIENLIILVIDMIAIILSSLLGHLDAAIRHERTLQRLVCLQANNLLKILQLLINIARPICRQARHNLGLTIQHTAPFTLFLL